MNKNQKVLLGIVYLICLGLILYVFFNFFDFKQINDYFYIKEKTEVLIDFKNKNFYFSIFLSILFCIIWVLLLGFATPLALILGFVFGKYVGTLISVFSFTAGCTFLYILVRLYFRDLVLKYLTKKALKFLKFKDLFNKNELFYFMLFRFAGGAGIPFAIQNILPILFDMKVRSYFYSTLFGLVPTIFIVNSLGAGFEKIVQNNTIPSIFEIISNPHIYLPILGFLFILLFSYFIRNKFFKR